MPRKLTLDEVKKYCEEQDIDNECQLLSNEYKGVRSPLDFKCNLCGSFFSRTFEGFKSVKRKCCPSCSHQITGVYANKKRGIEDVQKYLDENGITTCTLISTEYINSKTPLEFKCNLCGKTFKKTFDNLKYAKFKTCASCSHKENGFQNKYTEKDVDEILAKDGYIRMEPYVNTHTPFKCRCSRGHDFTMHFSEYLADHRRCRYCAIEDRSGENAYQWKGGYGNVIEAFRYAADEWKKNILRKTPYCDITGETKELHVHHLSKNYKDIVLEALNNLNLPLHEHKNDYTLEESTKIFEEIKRLHKEVEGIVLSKTIHHKFHSIYGLVDNTKEQYLEFKEDILASLK